MPPKLEDSPTSGTEGRLEASKPTPPLSSSATGAVLLIAQQFGSRGLTFVVNQVLLRYLSPELLGVSTQLEVFSITVLFFSRESLRVAIQRQDDTSRVDSEEDVKEGLPSGFVDGRTGAGRTQAIVNLAYVSFILGIFFASLVGYLYCGRLSSSHPLVLETPYFLNALWIYGIASCLELLAEPCYVVVQQKSKFGIRAGVESTATVLRCFLTCGFTVWASRAGLDTGVLPFALGQCIYALSLFVGYYWSLRDITSAGEFSLLPKRIHDRYILDP
jgi:oligosaccharide translocation protein RFT1